MSSARPGTPLSFLSQPPSFQAGCGAGREKCRRDHTFIPSPVGAGHGQEVVDALQGCLSFWSLRRLRIEGDPADFPFFLFDDGLELALYHVFFAPSFHDGIYFSKNFFLPPSVLEGSIAEKGLLPFFFLSTPFFSIERSEVGFSLSFFLPVSPPEIRRRVEMIERKKGTQLSSLFPLFLSFLFLFPHPADIRRGR